MTRFARWFAAALAGLSIPAPARADDAADLQGLLDESVVTTASKSAQTASEAPATSTTITAEQLRRYGIASLDEAIDFLSLGAMTSNALDGVDIGARGVMITADQGAHFLLLVDGHAINEPLYGSARFDRGAGIPLELVDHIEVILGPGSVLYGSNAMFGVINVITKRAKHYEGAHLVGEVGLGKANAHDVTDRSRFGAPGRVELYRGSAGAGVPFTVAGTPGELAFALDYQRQDGPAFVLGPQGPSTEDRLLHYQTRYSRAAGSVDGIWGGVADRSYSFEGPAIQGHAALGAVELNFHASTHTRRAPYARLQAGSTPDFNDPENRSIERSGWADLRYHVSASRNVELNVRVYGDTREFDRQSVASLWAPCAGAGYCRYFAQDARYDWRGASRWIGVEVQSSLDWLADGSFATLLGADARHVFVGSKLDTFEYEKPDVPAGPSLRVIDETDRTLGLYLQQSWRPFPIFSLGAGARLDMGRGHPPTASPRAAATLSAWHGATLKAIFARAFRAPTWDERLAQDYVLLPAGDLGLEHVQSEELSLEQRLGAQRILVGAFQSTWTDLIERHILTQNEVQELQRQQGLVAFAMNRSQYRNVSEIQDWGMSALLEGSLGPAALRYGLNFTGAYARRRVAGAPQLVPAAPRFFGNARVSYDFGAPWPTVALASHFAARRPSDRAIDGVFESGPPYAPAQVELRATASGPMPLIRGLSYRVSADYATADSGPYVVGIYQGYFATALRDPYAELVPVEQLRANVGLQYDFP